MMKSGTRWKGDRLDTMKGNEEKREMTEKAS